jgi:hypothetical protein
MKLQCIFVLRHFLQYHQWRIHAREANTEKQQDQIQTMPKYGSIGDSAGLWSKKSAKSFWYSKSPKTIMPVSAVEAIAVVLFIILSKLSGGFISIILSYVVVSFLVIILSKRHYDKQLIKFAIGTMSVGIIVYSLLILGLVESSMWLMFNLFRGHSNASNKKRTTRACS